MKWTPPCPRCGGTIVDSPVTRDERDRIAAAFVHTLFSCGSCDGHVHLPPPEKWRPVTDHGRPTERAPEPLRR